MRPLGNSDTDTSVSDVGRSHLALRRHLATLASYRTSTDVRYHLRPDRREAVQRDLWKQAERSPAAVWQTLLPFADGPVCLLGFLGTPSTASLFFTPSGNEHNLLLIIAHQQSARQAETRHNRYWHFDASNGKLTDESVTSINQAKG